MVPPGLHQGSTVLGPRGGASFKKERRTLLGISPELVCGGALERAWRTGFVSRPSENSREPSRK